MRHLGSRPPALPDVTFADTAEAEDDVDGPSCLMGMIELPIGIGKEASMKGRNAQVTRIYKILTILEGAPHGLSVSDLVDRLHDRGFEVGKRTVYRDLDALRAAGFPLDERGKSEEQGTRWTLERSTRVNHYLVLGVRELFALYLARAAMAPFRDTPFYEDVASVFDKIDEKLGVKGQAFLSELSQDLHFEPGPRWGLGLNPDIVETLRAACTERQVLSISYTSVNSGKTGSRNVGPHFLYFAKGSLYFVGEDLGDKIVKVFSVARVHSAEMLETPYTTAPVDPERYFASAFGVYHGNTPQKIRIQFAPPVASFIKERRWHQTQRIVAKEGGAIEFHLEVDVTPELVQWVLGFGSSARVMEPAVLAQQIHDEAVRTAEHYSTNRAAG